MADIEILDQYNQGILMDEKDISEQYLYTLELPANTLTSGSKLRIKGTIHIAEAIPPDCAACEPTTDPGTQDLSLIYRYDYIYGIPQGSLTGNVAGQLNYVGNLGQEEEFIVTVGNRSGFGTSYDYPNIIGDRVNNGPWEILYWHGEKVKKVDPVSVLLNYQTHFFTQDAQGGQSGHSDEMGYLLQGIGFDIPSSVTNNAAYFSYDSQEVTFFKQTGGYLYGVWSKNGNEIYGMAAPGNTIGLYKVDLSQNAEDVHYAAGNHRYYEVFATDNYVYGLTDTNYESSAIIKMRKDNLEVITSYPLGSITNLSFTIIQDKAAYIYASDGSHKAVYYLLFSEGIVRKIGNVPDSVETSSIMHYRKGYFYFHPHNWGFGLTFVYVWKVGPLLCPGTDFPLGV